MTVSWLKEVEARAESACESRADPTLITHGIVGEVFQDAFRRRVGLGSGKVSVADLADAIDVEARTVKGWRDGERLPQMTHLLRLCAHFGPAFVCEILAPAGLGGVGHVAVAEDADLEGTALDLIGTGHDLLQRHRGGRFGHRDRAETAPRLLDLSRRLESQARALGQKPA